MLIEVIKTSVVEVVVAAVVDEASELDKGGTDHDIVPDPLFTSVVLAAP